MLLFGVGLLVFALWFLRFDSLVANTIVPRKKDSILLGGGHSTEIAEQRSGSSGSTDFLPCGHSAASSRPWFPPHHKEDQHIQLVFYGKPIMQVIKHLSVKNKWKVVLILNDTEAGAKELERLSSKPDTFTIVYTTSRAFHRPLIQELANSTNALVSAIRYTFKITGGKKGQLEGFRHFFAQHGCNLSSKSLMPISFTLDDPTDCKEFFKHAHLHPDTWWVLKPSHGYGGEGITIHTNLTLLYKKFATCQQQKQQQKQQKNIKASSVREFVVQEYLPHLLLLEGRKFDVRAFVLIASTTPYMLFYQEGYLRVSMEKFNLKGASSGVHLTNSHIQTHSKNFSVNKHFWSFGRFQSYLDTHHSGSEQFVSKTLVPFIKKVGHFLMQTGMTARHVCYFTIIVICVLKGMSVFEKRPSSFHLFGLDFMITDDLQVWFIEANNYPLWPKTSGKEPCFIDELMDNMGVCTLYLCEIREVLMMVVFHSLQRDMFELVFKLRRDPSYFSGMEPGQNFNSMQLIWNGIREQCHHKTPSYDPCTEF